MPSPETLSPALIRTNITKKLAEPFDIEVCYDLTIGIYLKAKKDYKIGEMVISEREEFVCDLQNWKGDYEIKIPDLFPKYQQLCHKTVLKITYLKVQVDKLTQNSSLSYHDALQFVALLMLNAVGCDCCGLKLFPLISKMMHSCSPNTFLIDRKDGLPVQIIATKPIKAGDIITRSYITDFDLFWTKSIRIEFISKFMHFTCFCERCIMLDPFDSFLCSSCGGDICYYQFSHIDDKVDIINSYKCLDCARVYKEKEIPLKLAFKLENQAFQIKTNYEKQIYTNAAADGTLLTELIVRSSKKLGPRHWCTIVFMEAYVFYYFHNFRKPSQHVIKFVYALLDFYATIFYKLCPIAAASRTDELLEWCSIPSQHLLMLFPFYILSDESKNTERWSFLIKRKTVEGKAK
eukprot:NODE_347_length_10448_cov_0.163687.p1 type:complete len:405 gc:universal NODE_347_length_10448_cov_0.163687:1778-564(-)